MENTRNLTHAAQIPAWLEVLTGNLDAAVRQSLQQQALLTDLEQTTRDLHMQVQRLNQNLESLLEVQLAQVETLQVILNRKNTK